MRVVGTDSRLEEIHVLARMAKPPKQVVRDVQSLAAAAFGIDVDRRIVSVVQLADGDMVGGDRPAIMDVFETTNGSRSSVRVTLEWNDEMLTGETSGAAANATRNRLVAEAVLEALTQALHSDASFAVASVDVPTLGSRRIAVAQIVLVTNQTERLMIGSAVVDDDESRAVVRAVLDGAGGRPILRLAAAEAERLGLVTRVVPADDLDATVDDISRRLAAGPPLALSSTKRLLDQSFETSLSQALEAEAQAQAVNMTSLDTAEAMAAFVEKREPTFGGH